ncbi:MAG TPA: hypothetical protein VFH89_08970 [Sphingomicrobium sp.]|nr:hypothetical protein [Sphingomicrobium sp.]
MDRLWAFAELLAGLLNPWSGGRAEMRNCDRKRAEILAKAALDISSDRNRWGPPEEQREKVRKVA